MRPGSNVFSLVLVLFGLGWLTLAPAAEQKKHRYREPELTDEQRAHWAFRPPVRPALPRVRHPEQIKTPVDAFVLARLEKAGLDPAPLAGRAALLRRVTFDLTGLPPTPEEVDRFLQDSRFDAYARVVERLLASPGYGERWAQHWLDVVRYAESNGYELDAARPHAWRYRDYVIRALNEDRPYDQLVREQLAGDELAAGQNPAVRAELLIAGGFNRCGPVHLVIGNLDPEVQRQEVLTEMTGAVGWTFLGLTVACARCHDHKFDPISQGDYYRLQAFFAAAQPKEPDLSTAEENTTYQKQVKALQGRLELLRRQVAQLDAPHQQRLRAAKVARLEPASREALAIPASKRTPAQRQRVAQAAPLLKVAWDEVLADLTPAEREKRAQLRARIHILTAQMPPPPAHAWTIQDQDKTPPTHVLVRGNVSRKGVEVQPAFPRILIQASGGREPPDISRHQGAHAPRSPVMKPRLNRAALAEWLTGPNHPLTARVIVNRLWQHHFGRGIVATPNDFGFRGAAPTHPELLDWLATELIRHRWSLKHVHRLILLSRTYRQAGRVSNPRAKQVDPNNHLLWHAPRQRLEGEALRDTALAVAGTLNPKMGGPMVRVPLEPEVYELIFTEGEPDGLWLPAPDAREHNRRSIYLFAKRNLRLPLLEAFDRPDSLTSCPVRPVSTFAPQALILLNGPFLQEQSKRFASRLLRSCGPNPDRQIELAYRLALARPPRPVERTLGREFLISQTGLLRDMLRRHQGVALPPEVPAAVEPAAAAALADFCLAVMNCNEFVYVE